MEKIKTTKIHVSVPALTCGDNMNKPRSYTRVQTVPICSELDFITSVLDLTENADTLGPSVRPQSFHAKRKRTSSYNEAIHVKL